MRTQASIIPTLQYKNAAAAVDWLCHAFGFEKKVVYADDNGAIVHSQLVIGNSMIMVSSQSDTPFGKLVAIPRDLDKLNTQSAYIVIDDSKMKSHYETAIKAGATIALDLRSEDYGGQSYSVYDPEGHLWNFGSFDPWVEV